jgi:hypothetical protein
MERLCGNNAGANGSQQLHVKGKSVRPTRTIQIVMNVSFPSNDVIVAHNDNNSVAARQAT